MKKSFHKPASYYQMRGDCCHKAKGKKNKNLSNGYYSMDRAVKDISSRGAEILGGNNFSVSFTNKRHNKNKTGSWEKE